jgi:transposase
MNPTIDELTAAAEQEARKRPDVVRLMTHPGVGPLTTLAYVLIIGTPERFHRGKQIGTYVRMIPSEDSSAGKQRLGHISKQGNSLPRFLLVEAAQAAARINSDWRRRYVHLAMRRHKSIAKVAMGRKLAVRLYWMWRNGRAYSSSLEFGSYVGQLGTGWCEVECRPLDWASRSLRRESEEVIVVEVLIEEMFRSDRNRPTDYERAVVVEEEVKRNNEDHSSE